MEIRIPPRTYTAGEVPPITPIERARVRNLFEKRYRASHSIGLSRQNRERISFVLAVIVILAILAGFAVFNGVDKADASERIEIVSREFLHVETDSVSLREIPPAISWEPSSGQYMDDTRFGGLMLVGVGIVSAVVFYAAGANAGDLAAPLATAGAGVVLISFSPAIARHRMKGRQ